MKITRINKKRPGLAHFLKKVTAKLCSHSSESLSIKILSCIFVDFDLIDRHIRQQDFVA